MSMDMFIYDSGGHGARSMAYSMQAPLMHTPPYGRAVEAGLTYDLYQLFTRFSM
jgi:hypothetical protein